MMKYGAGSSLRCRNGESEGAKMYKHAWGKRPTYPRLIIKKTHLDRQQETVELYLEQMILAELEHRSAPKMPWYLWKKYRNTVKSVGGLQSWALQRPEYQKIKQAVKRSIKRGKRGQTANLRTNGIGKRTSWRTKSRKKACKISDIT